MNHPFKILFLLLLSSCLLPLTFIYAVSDGEGNELLDLESAGEVRVRDNSDSDLMIIEEATGEVGIGIQPEVRLHVDSNAANTAAILELENTAGDVRVFRTDATPESTVTADAGDVGADSVGGDFFIKRDDGDNTTWIGLKGVLDKDFSSTTISNNAAEATLYSYTVPAGIMGANGILRLTLSGTYVNTVNNNENTRFRINFGSTEIYNDNAGGINDAAAGTSPFQMEIYIANVGSVSSQLLVGFIAMGDKPSGTAGVGQIQDDETVLYGYVRGSSSEDTDSGSRVLEFTVDHETADPNVSMTKDFALLELL